MSYALINKMITKPGKRNEVLAIMLESGKAFNDNPRCQQYVVSFDKNDENVLWVQDVWADAESHQAAMSDETMQTYVKQAMPLLKTMPTQIEIDIKGGKQPYTAH